MKQAEHNNLGEKILDSPRPNWEGRIPGSISRKELGVAWGGETSVPTPTPILYPEVLGLSRDGMWMDAEAQWTGHHETRICGNMPS